MLLDGYIRVSQVGSRRGNRFISPSVQREEIEAWTSSHNAVLGEVFEELDESGGRADRPLLMRAIERVESGESGGVIVAKLDRFGRSLLGSLGAIARIEAAGGTFVSVQDGVDLRTATGRLVVRVLLSIGEWELDRVRTNWQVAQAEAIARGVYLIRGEPIGYRRDENRRLVVVPEEAVIIREAFERRARGATVDKVAAFLNESELKTATGVPFESKHVVNLFKMRAYRGEIRSGDHHNAEAHEAIVDATAWQACQAAPKRARGRVQGLVSGRIRCAACGRMMRAGLEQRGGRPMYYNCYGLEGKCPEPAHAKAELLDPLVEDLMFSLWRRARPSGDEAAAERCEAVLGTAQDALADYRDNPRLQRTLGPEIFEAGLASRQRMVERRLLELSRAGRALRRVNFDVEDLEGRWSGLSQEERRAAVGEFIECVVVARGKGPMVERAWAYRRGRGPLALRDGRLVERFRPALKSATKLRAIRPWPRARIEAELGGFLAGRTQWPSYGEFAEEGCARLHAQAMAWGGPYFWGHKLGVEVRKWMVSWDETTLRNALAPLLEGRRDWPQSEEFEAQGMTAVRTAIQRRGGMGRWARELGFEFRMTKKRLWTEERIERELIEFVGGRKGVPLKREFDETGRGKLYSAMRRHGGIRYWGKQVGAKTSSRSPKARRGV